MKLLVTGAAGFIGSSYVRLVLEQRPDTEVVVLDKLTYAGRRENLDGLEVELVEGAIEDPASCASAMEGADAVVNFAAESHVDRSIEDQDPFALTHVIGTGTLLDAARELGVSRYLQVSTDEVYGSIESGSFTETSPLDPSSPYSATKAGGDLLVSAHAHTYGIEAGDLPGVEQLRAAPVPREADPAVRAQRAARRPAARLRRRPPGAQLALRGGLLPRDRHSCSSAGVPGEAYNAGGPDECENIEVVKRILELTGRDESLIEYVTDRPGHDRRYSLASDKVRSELGWEPQVHFAEGLERTVDWYRDNEWWWEPIRSGAYRAYYERQYGRSLG